MLLPDRNASCLSEALCQLSSQWQPTGVAPDVLEGRASQRPEGESLTLQSPHLVRALKSLSGIMPCPACLQPQCPETDLRCRAVDAPAPGLRARRPGFHWLCRFLA